MHNIVFAGDDKYIKYIAVAIASIVKSTDKTKKTQDFQVDSNKEVHGENFISNENLEDIEEGYYFHILTDFIHEETKAKLKGLEEELSKIFPIKIEIYVFSNKDFKGFQPWAGSYLPYYRFKIPEIIPNNVHKVLYLDGDMLPLGDVRELFAIDASKQILLAVKDIGLNVRYIEKLKFSINANSNMPKYTDFSTMPNVLELSGAYFNTGLLLINLENWKNNNISEKAIEFLQIYNATYPDQDALNWLCPDYVAIPNVWNILPASYENLYKKHKDLDKYEYTSKEFCDIIRKSNIIKNCHYIKKPWSNRGVSLQNGIIDMSYAPIINMWWEQAENTPYFKEDLLAVKTSKNYIKGTKKEARLINLSKKPLLFTIYKLCSKCNGKIKNITSKIEKPIKQIRNRIRYKLAQ